MINKLKKLQFKNISNLLNGELINIEVKAVAQGFNPGEIYVDNVENPKTALVWAKGISGFYFIGDENNPAFNDNINEYIDEVITSEAKKLGYNSFEFSGTSKLWDETIGKVFKNRDMNISKQLTYKLTPTKENMIDKKPLPKKYELKKINEDLLKSNISNKDFINSMILDWWQDIETFLEKGVGYCILHNEKVISCCISSCVTNKEMGSHTVTLEEYRKQGLGKKLINQYLKYCIDNGYECHWDCMETNEGSRGLATSLGYKKVNEYILYDFKLK